MARLTGSNISTGNRLVALTLTLALVSACKDGPREEPVAEVRDWSCIDESPAESPMRRLTRFEYTNIIRDIFELELELDRLLPRDEVALGFDNQAGALSVTDLHVESYFKVAELVARHVLDEPGRLQELADCDVADERCAEQTTRVLALHLLRRPADNDEAERLLRFFENDFSEAGYAEGISRVIAALLQSPEFLYRVERATEQDEPDASGEGARLAGSVLAARLAFLLWGSSPDAALLQAAESGELATSAALEREARRMLDHPRARRGVLQFFQQWLELSDFEAVEKDRRLLPIWDEELRGHLAMETRRFVEGVLWEDDARFRTLMTARYTHASPLLMDFYGLPLTGVDSDALVRVELEDPQRFGLLTKGALLSRLAKADQTSPVHRGKFIRERFFCTTPPPPPPEVVVATPRLDPRKTTRERFEQHRSDPGCATCHELLDPIGLAFEHYDAVGRYRTQESGLDIDASGYLVDTDVDGPLSGVPELSVRLTESGEVRRCLITHVFRYAFGRGETARDSCTLDKLEQQYLATDGDLKELLVALTQTETFTQAARVPAAEQEAP